MKVFYLNDEKNAITVMTRKKGGPEWDYVVLKPQQGQMFDVDLREREAVFIKRWYYGTVMIDGIDTQLSSEAPSAEALPERELDNRQVLE